MDFGTGESCLEAFDDGGYCSSASRFGEMLAVEVVAAALEDEVAGLLSARND
jgi:hypothetical protein